MYNNNIMYYCDYKLNFWVYYLEITRKLCVFRKKYLSTRSDSLSKNFLTPKLLANPFNPISYFQKKV